MNKQIIKDLKQKLFEKAVRGFRSQDWIQCRDSGGWCVLNKGNPGTHCAIGWLIPWKDQANLANVCRGTEAENLKEKFEDEEVRTYWEEVMPFLCLMQVCHDGATHDMKQRFMSFGLRHDLIWPELEEKSEL